MSARHRQKAELERQIARLRARAAELRAQGLAADELERKLEALPEGLKLGFAAMAAAAGEPGAHEVLTRYAYRATSVELERRKGRK